MRAKSPANASFLKANNELDATQVIAVAETLARRIADRFPNSELRALADKIVALAQIAQRRAAAVSRPYYGTRLVMWLVIVGLGAMMLASTGMLVASLARQDLVEVVTAIEAALQTLVLMGAGIFFASSLETRQKRARVVAAMNELRVLAHVVDMRQLAKDPQKFAKGYVPTANSPDAHEMSAQELSRYFNYCMELLALLGKIAALYGQRTDDHEAISAVNDVETLTNELGRSVWQKLLLLQSFNH